MCGVTNYLGFKWNRCRCMGASWTFFSTEVYVQGLNGPGLVGDGGWGQ